MSADSVIDVGIRQWTADLEAFESLIPDKWEFRMQYKQKVGDPISGTLMPRLPWYHASWNEDSPDYDRDDPDAYTNSEQYRSPDLLDERLAERGVDTAVLAGHEIRFLPSVLNNDYAAALAAAYNDLLVDRWLEPIDRFKGGIVAAMDAPDAAVEEIQRYATHPDVVTVTLFSGGRMAFGHDYYEPVFAAAADAGLPVTVYTYGDPVDAFEPLGRSQLYSTFDTNITMDHMTNLVSLVFNGRFDQYPDLEVIWAGQGVEWVPKAMWRSTRYYRNFEPNVPAILEKEPQDYIQDNCYFTTHPLGSMPDDDQEVLFEMVGVDNILFASGYPEWHADNPDVFSSFSDETRQQVQYENAKGVFGL